MRWNYFNVTQFSLLSRFNLACSMRCRTCHKIHLRESTFYWAGVLEWNEIYKRSCLDVTLDDFREQIEKLSGFIWRIIFKIKLQTKNINREELRESHGVKREIERTFLGLSLLWYQRTLENFTWIFFSYRCSTYKYCPCSVIPLNGSVINNKIFSHSRVIPHHVG